MASPEEYAQWIVANQAKKGTPEFDTVVQAYQHSKSVAEVPLESDKPGLVSRVLSKIPSGEEVGGAVTDALSQDVLTRHLPAEVRGAAGYVANVGYDAVPLAAGAVAAVAAGGAALARKGAEKLMNSSLKPTLEMHKSGAAARAVDTMLAEGRNATAGGVEQLRKDIGALNDQVNDLLKGSGATIDKGTVASRIADVIANVEKYNSTPQDAIAAVERVYEQFRTNRIIPKDIPVQQANDLKVGIHKMLRDKYGELGSDTVEAQKALARGFREEIATAVPGVADKLKKEGDLINALNVTERRVMMSLYNNIGGLATLAHNAAGFAAFMADKSALFKSMVARMLNSGQNVIPAAAGAGAGAAVREYMEQPR